MAIARLWNRKQITEWFRNNAAAIAENRWSTAIIALIELAGCTLFPIPVAFILMLLVLASPRKWLGFALGATAGSVLGALVLYIIGRGFFYSFGEWLLSFYGSQARWGAVVDWFQSEWGLAFIALAGVTTGLFRVASLGAGFTGMNPVSFILVLCVSRCMRWMIECVAVRYVGERIWTWPGSYFKYATAGAVLILLAAFLALTFAW
jgi:membrane protein YqaA with SNARE-associated domain